ncbi:arginyl-tRNA synthetase [Arthrobacter woluwensis]|uniref:arginine--tRNA ligase n=1 Tax=Arthrobacter woluwensis TaxID=156980 RepID=UPI002785F266|nr:arginine--tRNA ligase [Arthrobacter woluwensis]MDQ0710223.1 arginyl-tRNA synthetase [Arthrobacter woluwensis]
MNLTTIETIQQATRDSAARLLGVDPASHVPQVRRSTFADFQVNDALSMARAAGRAPREIAAILARDLAECECVSRAEVSGPGYVNLTLDDGWLLSRLAELNTSSAASREGTGRRVVIDYSSPNVAKSMHVGHLRTTVVGDALANIHEHLGDEVIRQNHIGDWGTPFGMILEYLLTDDVDIDRLSQNDVGRLYRVARARFDADPAFAEQAKQRVVLLQSGDPTTVTRWKALVARSVEYFQEQYRELGVGLAEQDIRGESFYNDDLAAVCGELEAKGLASLSDGALCAFPRGFIGRDGERLPLIVRKSDGGYGYAATDLAAIRFRTSELAADRIVYVVGAPQRLHFAMLFQTALDAGWVQDPDSLRHVEIGNVLGQDGKILKTRSGDAPLLSEALGDAVDAAERQLASRADGADPAMLRRSAHALGIGALKFADLSTQPGTGYIFDLARMLKPTGNTGPYVQYAVVRLRSLRDKTGFAPYEAAIAPVFHSAEERELGIHLLDLDQATADARDAGSPALLCDYLVELGRLSNALYERVSITGDEDADRRRARLSLFAVTERRLVMGLSLLGIDVPEVM